MPPSLITAAAAGAAAGKNPWLPFAVLFLLATFARVPSFLMEPGLHRGLHDIAAPEVFLGLALVFLTLAVLESFADKIHWIECWLTPLSAAWRPFAAVGVSVLIAHAVASGEDPGLLPGTAPAVATLPQGAGAAIAPGLGAFGGVMATAAQGPVAVGARDTVSSGALYVVTLLVGTLFGLLATVGKIGTRLLLEFLPVPHLKLAHSCLDDVFVFCVTVVGLCLTEGRLAWLAIAAGSLYLLAGVAVGPVLTRLTYIQFRRAWALMTKAQRCLVGDQGEMPATPRWIERLLVARGEDVTRVLSYPAYTYRAPGIGYCRVGYLVWHPGGLWFVARGWLRPRLLALPAARLTRVGFADTVTVRQLVAVEALASGDLREHAFALFPARAAEIERVVARGAAAAGWVQVKPRSPSARQGLPGVAARASASRFVPAARAGNLELQGLTTVFVAAGVGILTVGAVVPIGAGYLLSPFKPRFLLALAVTAYLSLLALTGAGWPIAVFYGVMLNVVALRDLARQAVKAHVDGYVDRGLFLPPVCGTVFVPPGRVEDDADRGEGERLTPVPDGSWRKIARALRTAAPAMRSA